MRCIARAAGEQPVSSRFFFDRMASILAGSAGASKRRWAAPSGETVSGAGSAKL
jgi:hypothetical protein